MFWFPQILLSISLTQGFYTDHGRGWHWYETLPKKEENEQEDSQEKASPITPTQHIKAYQKELEELLHQAWLNPTSQNVMAYQKKQKDMTDRSKIFSTVWMKNIYQIPELDHTLVSPVNQQARHLQIDEQKKHTRERIIQLSETHGLFFFFSSQCPYCHQFAPVVKRFSDMYGWEVIPISVDGGSVAEFPSPQIDHGLVESWNIQSLPALYAVNPQTREVIPLAHGLTSLDEMESRIMMLRGDLP